MIHRRLTPLLLLGALSLTACQTSGSDRGADLVIPADAPAGTYWRGDRSLAAERAQIVARSAQEWSDLWARVGEAAPVSLPDDRMAAAVFLGPRDTAGFGVVIDSARTMDGGLRVGYRERVPGPAQAVALTQTSPYAIRLLPRIEGKILFQREK
jgi:hypothetical protein